jgi:RNA polymerase sigma-70 factor (ECF subfamily)
MSSEHQPTTNRPDSPNRFQTTHWSVVIAAAKEPSADAAIALEQLCRTYWVPLYAFVRRRGFDTELAADLTQGFFADLLRRQDLRSVDPQKGRFRSFLLAAFKHFIANQLDRQNAQKRGGGFATLSMDFQRADQKLRLEPYHEQTPESVFLRQWALTLLEQAQAAVREEYAQTGREQLFEAIQIFLAGDSTATTYGEVAERLEKTEGAIKVAVHRLRQRFHRQIREEIARTVASEEQIDAEIQDLFDALRT